MVKAAEVATLIRQGRWLVVEAKATTSEPAAVATFDEAMTRYLGVLEQPKAGSRRKGVNGSRASAEDDRSRAIGPTPLAEHELRFGRITRRRMVSSYTSTMGDFDDLWTRLEGFEWDAGNSAKNWLRHEVQQVEAEQALLNTPLVVNVTSKHRG